MSVRPPLGLDHLSVNSMPPLDFARLAAQAGYQSLSLFSECLSINPFAFPYWSLVDDAALRRDLRHVLDDLGIGVVVGEGCAIRPDRDVTECQPIIEAFRELGARRLNLLSFEPDLARDFDQMCRFVELAALMDMDVCIEFSARPGRPKLDAFMARIDATGMANLSALIDAMHFFAAGHRAEELSAFPLSRLTHLQLCDIRLDEISDYMEAALHERLIPGDGSLPLGSLIAALPPGIGISLEIPQVRASLNGLAQPDRLRDAASRSRALVEDARAHAATGTTGRGKR